MLADGARARNGFAALAALDANGDGTLDRSDPLFSKLVLWSDRNGVHWRDAAGANHVGAVVDVYLPR